MIMSPQTNTSSTSSSRRRLFFAAVAGSLLAGSTSFQVQNGPLHRHHQPSVSSLSLYVDEASEGPGRQGNIQTSPIAADNEWGIPDSKALEPLYDGKPCRQLPNGGKITMVGSGPGDPELLTVKALRLLQDPDTLVLCDRLVSQEIVDLIEGELKVARKLPGCAELAQEELYYWAHQGLAEGRHVVRLKIGDPFVFGRGGEEVLTFRRFGVEPEVIPVRENMASFLYNKYA
jgi:hypothetical protein